MADVRTRSVVLKQPTKSGFGVTGDHRKERMDEEKEEKTNQSRREGSWTKITPSVTVGLQVVVSPCCDQS